MEGAGSEEGEEGRGEEHERLVAGEVVVGGVAEAERKIHGELHDPLPSLRAGGIGN